VVIVGGENTPFGRASFVRYGCGMKTSRLVKRDFWYGLVAFAVTMAVLQAFDLAWR
jgi:hypothetical protein